MTRQRDGAALAAVGWGVGGAQQIACEAQHQGDQGGIVDVQIGGADAVA